MAKQQTKRNHKFQTFKEKSFGSVDLRQKLGENARPANCQSVTNCIGKSFVKLNKRMGEEKRKEKTRI